jgi:hypothetical protein
VSPASGYQNPKSMALTAGIRESSATVETIKTFEVATAEQVVNRMVHVGFGGEKSGLEETGLNTPRED